MRILQKVGFCKSFCKNTGLFFACRWKKLVFAVASFIHRFLILYISIFFFPSGYLNAVELENGEVLLYDIVYLGMNVGHATLSVNRGLTLQNKTNCMIYKSTAKSSSIIDYLYPVEDRMVSYFDPVNSRTIASSKIVHEGNLHREYYADYDYYHKSVNWWQKYHKGKNKISQPGDVTFRAKSGKTVAIPESLLDILSLLYYLRRSPTEPIENTFFIMPVYDDLQITNIEFHILKKEIKTFEVNKRETEYSVFKIQVYLATSGFFQNNGKLFIYLSADSERIPLKIEASIGGLGSVKVILREIRKQDSP